MKKIKLNLGSGNTKIKDYLNVDIKDMNGIDVVHDLNKPLPYKDGEVSNIFASHIIEHFWWKDTGRILMDWYRVLKKGGSLVIWTVDFDKLVYRIMISADYDNMMVDINWRLYGKEHPDGNQHHSMFTRIYMYDLLKKVGFKQVGLLDPDRYEFKPLHEEINLGLIAIK